MKIFSLSKLILLNFLKGTKFMAYKIPKMQRGRERCLPPPVLSPQLLFPEATAVMRFLCNFQRGAVATQAHARRVVPGTSAQDGNHGVVGHLLDAK